MGGFIFYYQSPILFGITIIPLILYEIIVFTFKSKIKEVGLTISNKDIANIKGGQEIKYSFDSLPYREYGFIEGNIEIISSNAKVDSEKGISFYTAGGSLDKESLESNRGEESFIKPGMTCEGRVITRKEKMIYYLLEKIGFKNNK